MLTRRDWMKSTALFSLAAAGSASVPLAIRGDEQGTGNPERSSDGSGQPSKDAIDIGSRRELFVDGLLVDKLDGVRLKLHQPQPAGVAVKYDGPADERFCFYTTIIKDGDSYRMYYRGHPGSDWTKSVTCYAESRDGIKWIKPYLGLVEVNGTRENNAILPTGEAFGPFIDGRPVSHTSWGSSRRLISYTKTQSCANGGARANWFPIARTSIPIR